MTEQYQQPNINRENLDSFTTVGSTPQAVRTWPAPRRSATELQMTATFAGDEGTRGVFVVNRQIVRPAVGADSDNTLLISSVIVDGGATITIVRSGDLIVLALASTSATETIVWDFQINVQQSGVEV